MSDDSEESQGNLCKIINIDHHEATVLVKYANGGHGFIKGADIASLAIDDVYFSDGHEWTKVPNQVWPQNFQMSVVRDVLEDGTIIGEFGNAILTISNPHSFEIEPEYTVEVDNVTQVISRVVSKKPIRVKHHSADEELSPTAFLFNPPEKGLSFDDFGGYSDVVNRAKELIETQLEHRDRLEKIGARPVKGILFTGPPGTGKTHLARIIANQADADFYEISGPAIVSKWVGDTEDLLRRIFDHAKASKRGRAIIFFDEIDSIAENRSGDSHEASRRLVAQFLTLMDGFETSKNATIVIAATNRADALDPALTRPGRFDWEIEFGLPKVLDRLEILKIGTRHIRCEDDLPLVEVALRTEKWSAARLASIWTEAALITASDKRTAIAGEDLAQAYERVLMRPERKGAHEV